MDINKVGFHDSVASITENVGLYRLEGHGVFQVFMGSPQRYNEPSVGYMKLLVEKFSEAEFVIHSPYWVTMGNPVSKAYAQTLKYSIRMSHVMNSLGIKRYVSHVGSRGELDANSSIKALRNLCLQWLDQTEGDDTILCLENDAGSKNGTKIGSIKALESVIRNIDSPRVRMCFDTEHAYANGFDLSDTKRLGELSDIIEVVHLNSIPHNVVKGGHLDRHSETTIEDCKEGHDYLNGVLNILYDGIRPFILERGDMSIVKKDIEFLRSYKKDSILDISDYQVVSYYQE